VKKGLTAAGTVPDSHWIPVNPTPCLGLGNRKLAAKVMLFSFLTMGLKGFFEGGGRKT
jgi:hypothetical protein